MKNIFPIIAVLATVLVSACILPGGEILPGGGITPVTTGRGLEITNFEAQPTDTSSGGTVRLIMEVENRGGANVGNLTSSAFVRGPIGTGTLGWTLTTGTNPSGFGKDVKAADTVRGLPAGTGRVTWSLTAPTVPAGTVRTYTFTGVTSYDYLTTGFGTVRVYPEAAADAARTAGKTLQRSEFTPTTGPVGLEVTIQPDPVILFSGEKTFSVTLKVSNAGGGTLYKQGSVSYTADPTPTTTDLNKVDVTVNMPGVTISGCTGTQELISGKATPLICDATLASTPTAFQEFPFEVTVRYGYQIERALSVTVSGR